MALSPADFYAYSRATGAPVPEDPEERARLAPEVLAFRRNQLRAPQSEEQKVPNALATAAGVGLALAGGIGAVLGAQRLLRGPKQSATAGVKQVNLAEMSAEMAPVRQVVQEFQPKPSQVPPQTADVVDDIITKYRPEYEKQKRLEAGRMTQEEMRRQAGQVQQIEQEVDDVLSQIRQEPVKNFNPRSYLEQTGSLAPSTPTIFERLRSVGVGMQGAPEDLGGSGIGLYISELNKDVDFSSPLAQRKLAEANVTQQEAVDYWMKKLLSSNEKDYEPEDLTSIQQQNLPAVADQKINAVESGEDQMTGRIKQQLQRNEDLNLSQIEILEDIAEQDRLAMMRGAEPSQMIGYEPDAAINTVSRQLVDGQPLDQAEGIDLATGKKFLLNRSTDRLGLKPGQTIALQETPQSIAKSSASSFLERERMEIASQLGEQGLPVSPSRIEAELSNRLTGSEAWTYGPKYTQRKQALQLGATYEPKFFENLKTPNVRIAGETIPTEMLKEPVTMAETAERLQEQVNKKRDWLGQVRLEEQKNKVRLMNVDKNINQLENYKNEITSFLSSGKATSEQARLGKQRLSDVSLDIDRLDTYRNELMQDVYSGEKRIQGARTYTESAIANLQLPQKLKSGIEEGQRVFFKTDAAGQVIPETMELRSERPMITAERKGGAGRNLAEFTVPERIDEEIRAIQGGGRIRDYDPETGAPVQRWQPDTADVGRVIDIYGIRPSSEFAADPEMRPSKPYPSKKPLTQELTPERIASVELSEGVRKAADPQAFLQQKMREAGVSAIGQFSPWPRRIR